MSSLAAKSLSFEFDTVIYQAGTNTTTSAQTYTIGFMVSKKFRAGFMQEYGFISHTPPATGVSTQNTYNALALNLEYAVLKSKVDAIIGFNIGSLNIQGTSAQINTASYTMTDIYTKVNYMASKKGYLNMKVGYRILPISDATPANTFLHQNTPFIKVGVGVKF